MHSQRTACLSVFIFVSRTHTNTHTHTHKHTLRSISDDGLVENKSKAQRSFQTLWCPEQGSFESDKDRRKHIFYLLVLKLLPSVSLQGGQNTKNTLTITQIFKSNFWALSHDENDNSDAVFMQMSFDENVLSGNYTWTQEGNNLWRYKWFQIKLIGQRIFSFWELNLKLSLSSAVGCEWNMLSGEEEGKKSWQTRLWRTNPSGNYHPSPSG